MKKIVIAGSAKLPKQIDYWITFFKNRSYEILDYPKEIEKSKFIELYPIIHIEFLENIKRTDILFIMNEDKNGKVGYIGYEAYAELLFGLLQKLVYHQDIELVILKMPTKDVGCYDEICLWLELGWIKLYGDESNEYEV